MIHKAAADAVGEVLVNGSRNGHCVLINRRQAVTCAHVLSTGNAKPTETFRLDFKRLGLSVEASVDGWRPYDPSLSSGSDLALLAFEEDAPEDTWVALEARRPATRQEVVAFEYQTARSDGDPREAWIHHGDGSVISLAGCKFIDPGMSGTGLFLREPGERLLGLVAWRPNSPGQTEAYAIPADEILKFQAELADQSVTNTDLRTFDGLTTCFLSQAGSNLRPLLEECVNAARRIIEKPAEAWTEEDINDLLGLHLMVADDEASGLPLPPGLAKALARLAELTSELTADCGPFAQKMPLIDGMAGELSTLKDEVADFRSSSLCPDSAKQPIDSLLRDISCALVTENLLPRKLSHSNALVQKAAGDGYRRIGRGMPNLLGQRPDLLPPGTIFVDSVEVWAPEMVVVPEGQFLMGSPDDEEGRDEDEGPQHKVEIGTRFALARFALTFAEFDAFCEATERDRPRDEGWGRDRRPVINVSWDDAQEWCTWISSKTKAEWRLPSEAEWEYACRAGTSTRFSFGDDVSQREARFTGPDVIGTLSVDHTEYGPNRFGLWQMHGNVFEWCADDWEDNYESPRAQALFLSEPRGSRRVLRGGSWVNSPQFLRSAFRSWGEPGSRSYDLGFRPARTLLPLSP